MDCSYFKRELETTHAPTLLNENARTHAAICSRCAVVWQEHLRLTRLLNELDTVATPADFNSQLRSRLYGSKSSPFVSLLNFGFSHSFIRTSASCAALILLVIVLHLMFTINRTEVIVAESLLNSTTMPDVISSSRGFDSAWSDLNLVAVVANSPNAAATVASDSRVSRRAQPKPHAPTTAAAAVRVTMRVPRFTDSVTRTNVNNRAVTDNDLLARRTTGSADEVKVLLPTTRQRMEVTSRDYRDEKEVLVLDAVSFGGQPLVQRAQLAIARAGEQQGVW